MTTATARARRARRWLVQLLATTVAALALVVLAPAAAPTANAQPLCSGYVSFAGKVYCPATIEGVQATQYGTGKRLYLDQVLVSEVRPTSVTVRQERYRSTACSPGMLCGAGVELYYVYLTVPWSGSGRPTLGSAIRMYGTSITSTLQPTGWEQSVSCGDYC